MPEEETSEESVDLEKELEEMKTPQFRQKYGENAELTDLTEHSQKILKDIKEYFEEKPHRTLSSGEVKEKWIRKFRVQSDKLEKWNVETTQTASLLSTLYPKITNQFAKLVMRKFFPEKVRQEVSVGTSPGVSEPDRRETINKGKDSRQGYILIPHEKTEEYFNKKVIERAMEKGINKEVLIKASKDKEHIQDIIDELEEQNA